MRRFFSIMMMPWLTLLDILAFGDKLMYALAAWVILQLILVDVIYRCLNRKYSD